MCRTCAEPQEHTAAAAPMRIRRSGEDNGCTANSDPYKNAFIVLHG
jgi:hypothetical protein